MGQHSHLENLSADTGLHSALPPRVDTATSDAKPKAGQPRIAAFFDVDETMIRGSSAHHIAWELYRRKFFGARDILFGAYHSALYLIFGESTRRLEAVKKRALRAMQGHSTEELKQIGESVYESVLGHRIFPGATQLVLHHLRAGHEVWLVSASPQAIITLIADNLGLTGGLGTEVAHYRGRYLARLAGPMLHGQGKAVRIQELAETRNLDLTNSFAYSDSLNDLPMLNLVGNPQVINPEPRLRLHALVHDWPVFDFKPRKKDFTKWALRSAQTLGVASTLLGLVHLSRRLTDRI